MSEKASGSKNFDGHFKMMLSAFMLNDLSTAYASEIGLTEFGLNSILYIFNIVFIGIPLLYSEIAVAQYTNCDAISVWNFFPLFRGVGYGTFFLTFLKSVNTMVFITWYMKYSYLSLYSPPPWFGCEEIENTNCMVKWKNVSKFHFCLELENVYGEDCNMETASNCIFDRMIGNMTTKNNWPRCVFQWNNNICILSVTIFLFLTSAKKTNFTVSFAKLGLSYTLLCLLVLFCATLLANGTWSMTVSHFNFNDYNYARTFVHGFATMNTGYGISFYIYRRAPFRNPAMMAGILSAVFTFMIVFLYGHIALCATKMMVVYHGGEPNVIEQSDKQFFALFASITEALSYISGQIICGSFWAFLWFSSILMSLIVNQCIIYNYLKDSLLYYNPCCNTYQKIVSLLLMFLILGFATIFLCSDLTAALVDAMIIIQITSSLCFSIALYWIYGFRKHNVDLVFMLGIKASYYWKISWVLNPIYLMIILFSKVTILEIYEYDTSELIDVLDKSVNEVVFVSILGFYMLIVVWGCCSEVIYYYRYDILWQLIRPSEKWGPRDKILFKSRRMFVPEIMTREFLYRQVKHQGYRKKETSKGVNNVEPQMTASETERLEQQDTENLDATSVTMDSIA